jgi:hypothetical protein
MLKKFRMEDCAPASTPMIIGCNLRKHDESVEENKTLYNSMIGNLIYVTTSRPDIIQAIGLVAYFNLHCLFIIDDVNQSLFNVNPGR